MADLRTTYLGLTLSSPLVASSSPLSESIDDIRRLEDAGAAAVVLYSLFEEQITLESQHLDRYLSHGTESFAEALTYFPDMHAYGRRGPDAYLEHVRRAMNVYYIPTDPEMTGTQVEQMYADLVRDVKRSVSIPVAVKLGHAWTALANVAARLDEAGADALVLFNRFYLPDFDLENLEVVPRLTLSSSHELLVRLHWVAILYGHVRANLAVTGGVHTPEDVVKAMMAGARVAMMASALLKHGIPHLAAVRSGLLAWMEAREYASIRQMQGSMSYRAVRQPAAFERANYMKVLSSYALHTE
jgi:dihydroorotate dehydrogenase (fumarate)